MITKQEDTKAYRLTDWLPTSAKEVKLRGWDSIDVILFSGDAYVDHPSFGPTVIGRILEAEGLKVAIVPQPNWRDDLRDFKKLGRPNLFFAVSAGNMDSMVNHYTANKRLRSDDAYTADGRAGQRPDYATIVYCNILKDLFPDVPIVIGGIEASLRRVTHYDYWSDKLKPSILVESKADLLIYGMGEMPTRELVKRLKEGKSFNEIRDIPQTTFLQKTEPKNNNSNKEKAYIELASHEICLKDKLKYAANFKEIEIQSNLWQGQKLVQEVNGLWLIINPPYPPMNTQELDKTYDLPYTRLPHPRYNGKRIPAYEMIRFSINIHRGCFGGCAFCTISAHQGKFIVCRSKESIAKEVDAITQMPEFKGYISDLGGPSANMYNMRGKNLDQCKLCRRPSCISPSICKNLNTSHQELLEIYKMVQQHPLVKKAFIGSGIRYDLIFSEGQTTQENQEYMRTVIRNHVSGRLKVAPEHTTDEVLKIMRKPSFKLFYKLKHFFDDENKAAGLTQQLIPYFISSHPGSTERDMAQLMLETKKLDFKLEQVQDFTPTPMTLSTEIYYTGVHPYTLEPIYTAKTKEEKLAQRKFFFWYKPENQNEIQKDLAQMGLTSQKSNPDKKDKQKRFDKLQDNQSKKKRTDQKSRKNYW